MKTLNRIFKRAIRRIMKLANKMTDKLLIILVFHPDNLTAEVRAKVDEIYKGIVYLSLLQQYVDNAITKKVQESVEKYEEEGK